MRSVDVLRETRALRGFTRVRDDVLKLSVGKSLLRRRSLPPDQDWLPAYVVKGEGVYFELDPENLAAWEARAEVQARADKITQHYGQVASQRGLQNRTLSPRFVLLHTLGHLLINQLVFACGYSSASLRERLYVSTTPGREMAGLLIYTAAGDSEGTMGGLVRMARPDNLRSVFASALSDARWCSTDPVCMDAGEKGQGPDSCNLAACHGCALLPETSCEEFNRFLDRGLAIGTFSDPSLGYFSLTLRCDPEGEGSAAVRIVRASSGCMPRSGSCRNWRVPACRLPDGPPLPSHQRRVTRSARTACVPSAPPGMRRGSCPPSIWSLGRRRLESRPFRLHRGASGANFHRLAFQSARGVPSALRRGSPSLPGGHRWSCF